MSATDFGVIPPYQAAYWTQELVKNAERSTMVDILARHAEATSFHRSVCRRNAMVRLFLARWGAIDALRELRDPPFQASGRVHIGRKWRDKVIP